MNILVLQSGGTTPVINATLAGVILGIKDKSNTHQLFTAKNGIYGAMKGQIYELENNKDFAFSILNLPGSSITETSRVGTLNTTDVDMLSRSILDKDIHAIINIGGNGTLQQSKFLSKTLPHSISVASCPKTVDNDLGDFNLKEVYFTPGFPSCMNWWNKHLRYLNIESLGSYSHDKVLVVQTFGRDTGFICASCSGNESLEKVLVYGIPESGITITELEEQVNTTLGKENRCIVIMSEGLFQEKLENNHDLAGQPQFSSGISTSAQLFTNYLITKGINSRTIIPNSLQRVFEDEVIEFDREVAFAQGYNCVKRIMEGDKDFLVTINRFNKKDINALKYKKIPENFSRKLSNKFIYNFKPSSLYKDYLKSFNSLKGLYTDLLQNCRG